MNRRRGRDETADPVGPAPGVPGGGLFTVADGFDAVVLAGDIQAPGHRGVAWAAAEPAFAGKPVFYVPGNHEYYGQVWAKELAAMRAAAQGTNVQVLDLLRHRRVVVDR